MNMVVMTARAPALVRDRGARPAGRHAAVALVSAALAGALVLTACGSASSNGAAGSADKLSLVAAFYPLQWVSEQVAGNHAEVSSLTKPGAEPHDLELAPKDISEIADGDLVVYLKGFQPAVDEAVSQEGGDHGYDAAKDADLSLRYTPIEEGQARSAEKGAVDPHFWLDPVRLAAVGQGLAERLATVDPDNASDYAANARTLQGRLTVLDQEFKTGLASCANKDLVTSHNAFGYLAQRYGLTQVGITGLTPEDEPRPSDLAAVADFVKSNAVHTIYYETLVSPAIARTVAGETGATTEVLDPIEGLTDRSQGKDYRAVMRSNLANIKKGQPCP
jgi:zinc transport system substrate-binding protein